jgi:hypothetical protein
VAGERQPAQHQASKSEERQQRARAGTTTWLDQQQGTMRVRVSCFTDTAEDTDRVYAAITRAITLVNSLLAQCVWYIAVSMVYSSRKTIIKTALAKDCEYGWLGIDTV